VSRNALLDSDCVVDTVQYQFHTIPCLLVWSCSVYILYPSQNTQQCIHPPSYRTIPNVPLHLLLSLSLPQPPLLAPPPSPIPHSLFSSPLPPPPPPRPQITQTPNPNPRIHSRYRSTMPTHSPLSGSAPEENSMHSSRAAFSSLQTQHGWWWGSVWVGSGRGVGGPGGGGKR